MGRICLHFLIVVMINYHLSASDVSPNYYCADMNPQPHVDIDQLQGLWYAVEIVSHKINDQEADDSHSHCPIIHLSEDNSPTPRPMYGNRLTYGSPYIQHNPPPYEQPSPNLPDSLGPNYHSPIRPDYGGRQMDYSEHTRHPDYRYANEYSDRRSLYEDIRRLRLMWDEVGHIVEYNVRYNVSRAGFWMSSGPQNGSSLEPQYNHFAGTIQVIKAVGNHLVLTFCHPLPSQKLYSVLLSRLPALAKHEINDAHELLTKRGLYTHSVLTVCSSQVSIAESKPLVVIGVAILISLYRLT